VRSAGRVEQVCLTSHADDPAVSVLVLILWEVLLVLWVIRVLLVLATWM
jgi:hypothetical protein